YLRLDERVHAVVPALSPRRHGCSQAGLGVSVRYPADQHQPGLAGARPGRGAGGLLRTGRGLVWRNADCAVAPYLQSVMEPPCAGSGRDRAVDHRRAGARAGSTTWIRDGPPAPLVPATDLAQSAIALHRL